MSPDDAEGLDEPLADLLAALDAHLAAGEEPGGGDPDLPPDQLRLYQLARDSLLRLERAWPRGGASGGRDSRPDSPSFDLLSGTGRLGKFWIRRELGRGGGSIVFLATDALAGREVALKLPRLEALLDPEARQRFLQEAGVAVGLDHPGLVPVYEAGEYGAVCYISSAYAGDTTLAAWLEMRLEPVPVRTAAALVAALARAVDYLHGHHILHRDIKPSNVLMGSVPAEALPDPELAEAGLPRLTDFGLAKLLDTAAPGTPRTATTGCPVLGTAEYMAPEQADGRAEQLGRPTDVYALGAVLYELLAGQPPLRGRNKFDTMRRVLADEPVRLRRLRTDVPRDLQAVCLRCLQKDPRRRYATAGQLAEDLQRFLAGQRTVARPAPWWRGAWRWLSRRPVAAALAAAGVVILPLLPLTWTGFSMYKEASRAAEERRLEEAWSARAKGVELCDRGDVGDGVLWLAQALAAAPDSAEDLRELVRLDLDAWRARLPALTAVLPHPAKVSSVQFSPDGRTVLTCAHDNLVRLWEADTGRPLGPPLPHPAVALKARFGPDGRTVSTVCADGFRRTWSAVTRELLSADPAGPRGGGSGGAADLMWEFELGRPPLRPVRGGAAAWLLLASPDRGRVLTLDSGCAGQLWSAARAEPLGGGLGRRDDLLDAAFGPAGGYIVTAGSDRRARFWGSGGEGEQQPPLEHPSPVHAVALAPSGCVLATGDEDALRLWEPTTRRLLLCLPRQGVVRTLAFSPDGRGLGAGSGDCGVRVWRLPGRPQEPLAHPLAGRPDLEAPDGARRARLAFEGILAVAYHPDGRRALYAGVDDAVRRWDVEAGGPCGLLLRHADAVSQLAIHPDGRHLLTGSRDGTARLWDVEAGRELGVPLRHPYSVGGAAFSPDGGAVATGCLDRDKVRLWDPLTGVCTAEFGPLAGVFDLAFSPDGGAVLAGSTGYAFHCDLRTGVGRALPASNTVFAVAYHPDGRTFVTGGGDGALRWWSASSLECLATVTAHSQRVQKAVFSPGGGVLATLGWDGRLVFWHSRTRLPVGPPAAFPDAGQAVAFHPGGGTALVGCKDGRVYFAPVPRPLNGSPRRIVLWAQVVTGMELGRGGPPRRLDGADWRQRRDELETEGGPP